MQKSGQFYVALQRQFRPSLHRGATPFALPKSESLERRGRFGAYATERRIALLPCDVIMLRCNILSPIFRLEVGRCSPNHEGDHESRPTGSLQVHLGSAILENSARCSGDGDVFLSTPNEQSRQGGPFGCAHHTGISDLGRGVAQGGLKRSETIRNSYAEHPAIDYFGVWQRYRKVIDANYTHYAEFSAHIEQVLRRDSPVGLFPFWIWAGQRNNLLRR